MARRYSIEGPDKHLYEFDAPEAASKDAVMSYAKQLFDKRQALVKANQNKGTLGDLGTALKQGIAELPAGLAGLADIPVELATGKNYISQAGKKLADVTGLHPSDYAKSLEEEKSIGYQKAQEEANALWKAHDEGKASYGDIAAFYAKHPALTATNVVESAPSMVLGGAYGRALKGVGALGAVARGAIGEGSVTAGQINQQLNEEGGGSRQKALAAIGAGAGTGLIGGASGKLARRMGIIDPETFLAGEAKNFTAKELADFEKAAQRGLASRFGVGALQEGVLQELPQSVQEQMFQNWGAGKPIMEGVARSAVEGTLAGSVIGGGFNTLAGGNVAQQIQAKKTAEAAAVQAEAQRLQRQATGVMDQQPLFTEEEAPIPAAPAPADGFTPPAQDETAIPEPSTSIPDVAVPTQDELFTPRGKPSPEALAGVEVARLQGLPAKIQELMQTPEGRAELAGSMKTYFPDLSIKERNALRPQIQAGTYGAEPVAPIETPAAPEGTLTPDVLKSFGITPRSKQYKALAGANLADPMTYTLLTTAASTNTDFGVKANRVLEAFPQFKPAEVVNEPEAQAAEPVQPDLLGISEDGAPPIEPGTKQGMGEPVQSAEAAPEEVAEPVGRGVDALGGTTDGNLGEPPSSPAAQPSTLAPVPKGVARKAAAELKKEPVAITWGYLSDTPYAKLSKVAKDKVKDAHAQGYLTQELADEIDRIEAGNARAEAAEAATRPELSLTEEAETLPDIPESKSDRDEMDYMYKALKGKSLIEATEWLASKAPSKSHRIIARIMANRFKMLTKNGVKFEFVITEKGGTDFAAPRRVGNPGTTKTRFQGPKGEVIVIIQGTMMGPENTGLNYPTVLHELLHAATAATIYSVEIARRRGLPLPSYSKHVDELNDLLQTIQETVRQRVVDGTASNIEEAWAEGRTNVFDDADELIAWGLTQPEAQEILESIKLPGRKTLWSEFTTVIRNLLGIPASENTALSAILEQSHALLNAPYQEVSDTLKAGFGHDAYKISNQISQQTKTPAFKKWFGNSKIVNEDGSPKVMYHGTPMSWYKPAFEANRIGLIFVTPNKDFANSFSRGNTKAQMNELQFQNDERGASISPTVLPVFVSSSNPFDSANTTHVTQLFNQLKRNGNVKGNTLADSTIHFGGSNDVIANNFDIYAFDMPARQLADGEWSSLEYPEIITALKQLGFDGLYVSEPYSKDGSKENSEAIKNIAVFEPTQLKSAVGNRGTFDAADEIITNQIDQRAQAQAQQYINGMSGTLAQSVPTQPSSTAQVLGNIASTMVSNPSGAFGMIEEAANKFRTKVIDKAAHLSAAIQDANDGAFYNMNGQIRADLLLSAANNVNNYTNAVFTKGGMEILPNGSMRAKDANHSVDGVFRHAQRLGERIGVEQARALITNAFYHYRAKSIIDNVPRDQWPENWQKDPRIIPTQAQINAAMTAFNQFPELRAMQTEFIGAKNEMVKFLEQSGFLSPEKARAFLADDSYAPWLRLKEYQDQIPGLGNTGRMVDLRQMKALVGGTEEVNDMLENMAQMIGWCVRSGVANHTANSALNTMSSMGTATRHRMRPTSGNPAHVVMTYEAGKPVFWNVDNPYDLAAFQTVSGMNSAVMKEIGKWLGKLRAGIVLFPAFPLRQVVMDSQRAFVEAGVDKPWAMMGKIYKSFLTGEAFRGTDADIEELMSQGVVGGADYTAYDTTRGRASQFGMGEAPKTISDKFVATSGYNFLHKLAYSADLAVRLGIYRQTLEETGDKTLAATRAREIINFQKGGTSAFVHTLKQTIPFMGAYLQGMDVNYKGMVGRGNSMKQRKAAAAAYWGNMAMYAGLVILYTMSRSGDDDYEDQKGFITDRNFVIPGGGLIPVPTDVGFLAKVLPERITDYVMQSGTENPESLTRLRQGIVEAAFAGFGPPAAVYGAVPAIEIATNYSFFSDMPIVSQRMQGLEPFQQYTSSTSEFAKDVGDVLNFSPMKIDYIFNAIGGTSAGALLQLSDVMMGSEKIEADKTPVISSFQQKTVGGRYAEEYYAVRELAERTYNTAKALQDKGDQAKLDEYLSDPRMQARIDRRDAIESIHQQLVDAQRQRNAIEMDTALSPHERRLEVNRINAEIEAGLRDAGIRQVRKELE